MNALSNETAIQLADDHGTPLYVYDSAALSRQSRVLQDILEGACLYYSLKANPNVEVARTLRETGCRVEIASGGELKRAIAAGFDAAEILFIGPGKTEREIRDAAASGVRRFVVDNFEELALLKVYTDVRTVTLRVNPDFEAKGGRLTMSGAQAKQFGIDRPQVGEFIEHARSLGFSVTGLHYYLGTRFLDANSIIANTQKIIRDAEEIVSSHNLTLEILDLGGGFGVAYFENEVDLDLAALKNGMSDCITDARGRFPNAEIAFESGRFLTAAAGQLILSVLASKISYGSRFCVCDGGTNLNMAAVGTGSLGKRNFPSRLVARRARGEEKAVAEPVTVTGPLCTPDDMLLKRVAWQETPQRGDLVVLERVGAYGPTASPHSFLGHEFPAEIVR